MYWNSKRSLGYLSFDQEAFPAACPPAAREKDGRAYPRVKDYIFIFCWGGTRQSVIEGITNNLSAGGACFDLPAAYAPGSEIWMELYLPRDYHKTLLESVYAKAEVVWTSELKLDGAGNKFRTGVSFTRIDDRDRERIVRYVEDGFVDRR